MDFGMGHENTVLPRLSHRYVEDTEYSSEPSLIRGLCGPPMRYSSHSGVKSYVEFNMFESKAASCVLELCLDALNIIGKFDLKTPLRSKVADNLKKKITDMYGVTHHETLYDPETIELSAVHRLKSRNAEKLKDDLIFFVQLLTCLRNDINIARMCDTLQDCMYYYKKRDEEEALILKNANATMQTVRAMNFQLKNRKHKGDMKNKYLDYKIQIWEHRRHDETVLSEIRKRLCEKHESGRVEQMHKILQDKEEKLRKAREDLYNKTEWDIRIHADLTEFLTTATDEIRNKVIAWSDKYDTDMEVYDERIVEATLNRDEFREELSDLQAVFERKEREINEYLIIREARQHLDLRASSALVLQAWWRANIFRKELIKPKKRRSGGRKKSKKGNKNKK